MSQTKYRNNFYLKGGALMYAYKRFAARPTLDTHNFAVKLVVLLPFWPLGCKQQ